VPALLLVQITKKQTGRLQKKDFVNKVVISRKGAKEARFFLRVISGTYIEPAEIAEDIRESEEIINILSSMIIKSTANRRS